MHNTTAIQINPFIRHIFIVQEGSGFIAVSTNKLIVYGSYSSAMNPSICVEAVEGVGTYWQSPFW